MNPSKPIQRISPAAAYRAGDPTGRSSAISRNIISRRHIPNNRSECDSGFDRIRSG